VVVAKGLEVLEMDMAHRMCRLAQLGCVIS
jgi:hypothetical protein